jgi:hypothetical protein
MKSQTIIFFLACLMLLNALPVKAQAQPSQESIIKNSLFDIIIEIPENYKSIKAGSELLSNIKLVNIGSQGRIDVSLDYEITSPDEKSILKKKETVAVETQANFVRIFDISKDSPPGKYALHVKLTYADGKEASAVHSFEVTSLKNSRIYYYVLGGIVVLALLSYLSIRAKSIIEKAKIRLKVHRIVKERLRK